MPAKKPTIWLLDEYKLSRDSWWFQLGIPKTLDFSRFFFLDPEKEEEKKEWDNMLDEILQVIRVYDRREALPQIILPQAMYADFKKMYARFPKENLVKIPSFFRVSDKFIMITEQLAELLGNFRLGTTQISPVKLYEKSTGELLSEQTFYFINVCEKHSYLLPEKCDASLELVSRGDYSLYRHPSDKEKAKKYCFSQCAMNCPVDIWHDPMVEDSTFLSDPLQQAIKKAGLNKGFSWFSCILA
jgi:hypothetical protein